MPSTSRHTPHVGADPAALWRLFALDQAEPAATADHLEPDRGGADGGAGDRPEYWVQHLRNTVDFQRGMAALMDEGPRVFMEMGPGRALSSLAQANGVPAAQVVQALRHPEQAMADDAWHIGTIARLWACGVAVDWEPVWAGARRNRVPLPTYAFQRKALFHRPRSSATAEEAQAPVCPGRGHGPTGAGSRIGGPSFCRRSRHCGTGLRPRRRSWLVFLG